MSGSPRSVAWTVLHHGSVWVKVPDTPAKCPECQIRAAGMEFGWEVSRWSVMGLSGSGRPVWVT